MKKHLLFATLMAFVVCTMAQSNAEDLDMMQAKFGKKKKEMFAKYIVLDSAQTAPFWELYDAYETERKAIGKKRFELFNEYVEGYETITSEQADEWSMNAMGMRQKTDSLIEAYYPKVKNISNGIVATQFYQMENYILNEIRYEILEEIPFINEK